ncbi:hypothetical protein GQ44DRAFT_700584 [Phaeosphaeriaceae sp. PMI808]|nr:hypothetical protein GQ44DRAFT_700584 [Phaeosphaeriaceae sp. PMI808]
MNEGLDTAAFSNITITKADADVAEAGSSRPALSFSRAYNLARSPQLIYARSSLLQYLVSSRVYRQLDFLAVGSWWVYASGTGDKTSASGESKQIGRLLKVPNGREDVFQDHELDFKAKRALMKFLRFIGEYEEQAEIWEKHRQQPFPQFLAHQFKVPQALQHPLMALTLSPNTPDQTTTEYALPRIARHLRSIGVFGAGFGAVIPKWGGLAEITQVSCRACAVGGGVYVLGKGICPSGVETFETTGSGTKLLLKDGEAITARWIVGGTSSAAPEQFYCRSMSVISSALTPLFPPTPEEAPSPASAVVVFPSGSLSLDSTLEALPPVQILVHSSDTGECPAGQSVLYASTLLKGNPGFELLSRAIDTLLATVDVSPQAEVLWRAQYHQQPSSGTEPLPIDPSGRILRFPPLSMDLAFDDEIFGRVKDVWEKIVGDDAGEFLVFQDREVYDDDNE